MSEVLPYPVGIDFRPQRPRGAVGGALLGALLGYALTQGSGGAIAGSALGGAIGNQPLPLNEALRLAFASKQIEVVGFYRLGPGGARILFRFGNAYWTLESRSPESPEMTQEQIEDWLYGDILQKLEDFLLSHKLRLEP